MKPAQTAREWELVRVAGTTACLKTLIIGFEGPLDGSITRERPTPEQYRHAIAAVALDGQPFGFTREDVIALRKEYDAVMDAQSDEYWDNEAVERVRVFQSIADRIEALLPPEG